MQTLCAINSTFKPLLKLTFKPLLKLTRYIQSILIASHNQSSRHRKNILQSDNCGCFYCQSVFKPADILEWIDDDLTALCPNCGIDSVIGDKSGYPVTDLDFLKQMHTHWF